MNETALEHFLDVPEAQNGDEPTGGEQYIHIRNWDRFQHPDTTRATSAALPWIKDYTAQLSDFQWMHLTFRQRGILQGLRLLYAANRGRGLGSSAAQLGRMLGDPTVRARDLESLNHAGFIEYSASRLQEKRLHDASPEEVLRTSKRGPAKRKRAAPSKKRRKNLPPCPECDVGGGEHTADCPTLTPTPS